MRHPHHSFAYGALIVLVSLLSACTNSYRMEPLPIATNASSEVRRMPILKVGDEVAVALPADGRYGNTIYTGSGTMTQNAIIGCLREMGVNAREAATEAKPGVVAPKSWTVTPLILEWEDRATELSGLPDRIRVELRTTDPAGQLRDATSISGASKWATFGGDHPQDMLRPALLPWAQRIATDGSAPKKP